MPAPQDFRRRRASKNRSKLLAARCPVDGEPGWTGGIRALYDGVAQEPLPAEFVELLAELAKKAVK